MLESSPSDKDIDQDINFIAKDKGVEESQPFIGLGEKSASDLKRVLGYDFVIQDAGDSVQIEISHADGTNSRKGTLPKTAELQKMIERMSYSINNFGEAYGMPEAEVRKTLSNLAEKLQ